MLIAELVAMFYMAAYLFINLSCFLEQWSSPMILDQSLRFHYGYPF